jgi:hypothetical protein
VRETFERDKVMLAQRREGDVSDHDHLVMVGLKRHPKVLAGVSFGSFEEFNVHVGDSARRVEQTVSVRVFADCL